jgi:RNA polymerase sigma-70 factor (ECF subfamily)
MMFSAARDPTNAELPEKETGKASVVEQAQAGDIRAFETLFERYSTRINAYLTHMVGNEEEGRDLAQETFLKAWQSLGRLRKESHFDTWLYRIATHTAIDYLRRRKIRSSRWEMLEQEYTPVSLRIAGPEEQIAEKEHIRQALAKVSLPYRSCLLLQLVADFSQRQIAASLHISEKSVSVYVSRGCEQFRKAYQQLSHSNEQLITEKGKTNEHLEQHSLFRLGTEAFSKAFG